jgi:CRISPR-associated protein Cas1
MASSPFPILPTGSVFRDLPDYMPARMVNEYVYCPRLFFYEWVEGVFQESVDTLAGSALHRRVDKEGCGLPSAEEIHDATLETHSITLSSEILRVIAKLDVLEVEDGLAAPVYYKKGRPREGPDGVDIWPADRVQLALQGLVLRENGYKSEEGIVYYRSTKQRIRVAFEEAVVEEARDSVRRAWELARQGGLPPPLVDSPKCPGCSLVPICLPDEVNLLIDGIQQPESSQLALFVTREAQAPRKPALRETRRLVTPRDDLRPVYLDTQGLRVGKSGTVLQVRERDKLVQEIRMNEIGQLNLYGNVQVTTQAIQSLCEAEIPICYFSMGGWFYGITSGLSTKNVFLRQSQFTMAREAWFSMQLARRLVAGKIRNQRTFLQRNHIEADINVLRGLKEMAQRAEDGASLPELLGLEGNAARLYFGSFQGMLKSSDEDDCHQREIPKVLRFDFAHRSRRPPRDAVNALLSLGYSLLAKDLTIACYSVGFDPMMGFYHQPRAGRPALALDLMEPFRSLIVDSAVVNAINTRMVTPDDFIVAGESVALKPAGRKAFYRAYELRMDSLVTHPLFDYWVSYRRMLEIQTRLLAKWVEGEIGEYFVFVTR